MRHLFAVLAIGVMGLAPAFGFDSETQDVLDRMKLGKPIPIADVATLMRQSERWCYIEEQGACSWSDIYLEVTDETAVYEIGNAWDADRDIAFTDRGTFEEGRFICEAGYDWVQTMRGTRRGDGSPLVGRDLWALKAEIGDGRSESMDCFDYVLKGADEEAETITLLQRQFTGGATDPMNDVTVTVHFNPETAAALSLYY